MKRAAGGSKGKAPKKPKLVPDRLNPEAEGEADATSPSTPRKMAKTVLTIEQLSQELLDRMQWDRKKRQAGSNGKRGELVRVLCDTDITEGEIKPLTRLAARVALNNNFARVCEMLLHDQSGKTPGALLEELRRAKASGLDVDVVKRCTCYVAGIRRWQIRHVAGLADNGGFIMDDGAGAAHIQLNLDLLKAAVKPAVLDPAAQSKARRLYAVTLVHESILHAMIRVYTKTSPPAFIPRGAPNSAKSIDSGWWVEINAFGGMTYGKPIGGPITDFFFIDEDKKKWLVPDNWLPDTLGATDSIELQKLALYEGSGAGAKSNGRLRNNNNNNEEEEEPFPRRDVTGDLKETREEMQKAEQFLREHCNPTGSRAD